MNRLQPTFVSFFENGTVAKLILCCIAIHTWLWENRHILDWHSRHGMATVPATVLWVPLTPRHRVVTFMPQKTVWHFLLCACHFLKQNYIHLAFIIVFMLCSEQIFRGNSSQGRQVTLTELLFGTWHCWVFGIFGNAKTCAEMKPY